MREEINSDTELYLACKKQKKIMNRNNIKNRKVFPKRLKRIKKKKKHLKSKFINDYNRIKNFITNNENILLKNISLNNESLILRSMDHEYEIKSRSDNVSIKLNKSILNNEISHCIETESLYSKGKKQKSLVSIIKHFSKMEF